MRKTVTFEVDGWVCDCGKEWPESVETCACGKHMCDQDLSADERTPYLDEFTYSFPAKNEVCPCCQGTGKTAFGYSQDNQIAWTESEWAEEDYEFREDYMRGRYDKTCPECNGNNVVLVIDEQMLSEHDTRVYNAWYEHMEGAYYDDGIAAAERAFGC